MSSLVYQLMKVRRRLLSKVLGEAQSSCLETMHGVHENQKAACERFKQ
jgi:hypothetical protein